MKLFLYIYHGTVAVGQSAYKWAAQNYETVDDAEFAAKEEVRKGASSVQIFQLLGTAMKDIVIA